MKCLNCGAHAEQASPAGCEKCIPNNFKQLGGFFCPQCGDEIEPDDPKGDGHIVYRCDNCSLDVKRI